MSASSRRPARAGRGGFGSFLRQNIGEFALVVASAWAVSVVACNAFFLDSLVEIAGWWGRAGLCLVVTLALVLVLYMASFRRDRLVVGVIFYVAIAAVLVSVAMVFSSSGNMYEDAEGNYLYLAFVLIGSATACFALTRTLTGSAIWFVAAAFCCSVVQAFYESEELVMSMVATFTSLALIVNKNFRLGLEKADQASAGAQRGGFASSVLPVAGVFAVALVLWFGVIAPLGPATADVKLVTEYRMLPIEEYRGVADEHPQFNYSMTTDDLVDGFFYTTDDLVEDPLSTTYIDAASMLQQQLEQQVSGNEGSTGADSGGGSRDTFDEEAEEPEADPRSYTFRIPWVIVGIVVGVLAVAGVVGYFVGRRLWRTRRLEGMLALEPADQVEQLYRFELGRLGKIGFTVPVGMTLAEFAESSTRSMDMLTEETRVPFDALTKTYCACAYGDYVPTEDEIVPFVAYYLGFWQAARAQLGNIKYFIKSFRL